jgi:hypothetical protein
MPGRYAPLMKRAIILFATTLSMAACGTRQSNLNRTIGWKAPDPNNYTVLYLKLNLAVADPNLISLKHKLDSAVVKRLLADNLGDQAANDDPWKQTCTSLFQGNMIEH